VLTVNKTIASFDERLENLDDLLTSLKSFTYKRVEQMENQMKTDHHGIVLSIRNVKNKLEEQTNEKFEELDAKIDKILKALSVE